jgi:Xaa-Pro dipeptidase
MNLRRLLSCAAALVLALPGAAAPAVPAPTLAERREEIALKETRMREWLESARFDGVLLGTQRNFAWFTAGGDNHVVVNSEEGAAVLLWTPERKHVIVANNEVARITREELAGLGYEPATFLWHEESAAGARATLVRQLVAGRRIASDLNLAGAGVEPAEATMAALRFPLTEHEVRRYRWLARTAAGIVEAVARETRAGQTESAVQAGVAGKLLALDILPTVLLVAADERIALYKHPVTKDAPIRREVMITLCARKWGMVVAVTRHVHLGALPVETQRKQQALGTVFAAMVAATTPGNTSGAVVEAARKAYAASGHGGLWDAHHLGGAIGYREREYRAFPGSPHRILESQAFAWNPTLPGVKAEDTLLVTRDGVEVLTDTRSWPRAELKTGGRTIRVPQILVRSAAD